MLINRKELEQISQLAKLNIEEKDMQPITDSLDSIMNMIQQINNVDTQGIRPMANPLDAIQRLRVDTVTEDSKKEVLLDLSANVDEDFYLVPKVVD